MLAKGHLSVVGHLIFSFLFCFVFFAQMDYEKMLIVVIVGFRISGFPLAQ